MANETDGELDTNGPFLFNFKTAPDEKEMGQVDAFFSARKGQNPKALFFRKKDGSLMVVPKGDLSEDDINKLVDNPNFVGGNFNYSKKTKDEMYASEAAQMHEENQKLPPERRPYSSEPVVDSLGRSQLSADDMRATREAVAQTVASPVSPMAPAVPGPATPDSAGVGLVAPSLDSTPVPEDLTPHAEAIKANRQIVHDTAMDGINKGFEQQSTALKNMAALEQARMMTEANLKQQAMMDGLKYVEQEQAIKNQIADQVRDAANAYSKANDDLLTLSKQSPNPYRYWQNESDGSKAGAVVMGFLNGFAGQGGQYLGRLDALVDRDIKLQLADLDNRRQGLASYMQGKTNLIGMFEREGLHRMEAVHAAKAHMMEQQQQQIEAVKSTFGGAQEIARADKAIGELEIKKQQELQSIQDKRLERAYRMAQIDNLQAKVENVGQGKALTTGEKTKVNDFRQGASNVTRLAEEYMNKGDVFGASGRSLVKGTAAYNYENAVKPIFKQFIAKGIEGGVLRKEDEAKYDKFIPSAFDAPSTAREKLRQLNYAVGDGLRIYLDTLQRSGNNVTGFSDMMQQPTAGKIDFKASK